MMRKYTDKSRVWDIQGVLGTAPDSEGLTINAMGGLCLKPESN